MISLMGQAVLRMILQPIQRSRWYTIIADETTDLTRKSNCLSTSGGWILPSKFMKIVSDLCSWMQSMLIACSTEINSSCNGKYGRTAGVVLAQLDRFQTFFGLKLAHLIFGATEQTSRMLQTKDCSLQEGLQAVEVTQAFVKRQRTDEAFGSFFDNAETASKSLTAEPALPRIRNLPNRLDNGSNAHRFADSRAFFRQQYFEALDIIYGELERRFNRNVLAAPKAIEEMLISPYEWRCEMQGDS
jgi:hypothetical protein